MSAAQYNLATLLEHSAEEFPERDAVVMPRPDGQRTRLDYRTLDAHAATVANLLRNRGIGRGDRVALSCPNLPYFTIVYFGILKTGAAVVPLNVLLKGTEIAYHLRDSGAKAYFCFEGTPELPMSAYGHEGFRAAQRCEQFFVITADPTAASPIEGAETLAQAMNGQPPAFETVATDEDDTAVVLYTSGTTGQPKGAELRHRNMRDNALTSGTLLGADPSDPDTYLCVLPLFHSFGQTVCQNGALAHGGTIVMLPRFEPRSATYLMLDEKVTFFAGVPTMYWALLGVLDELLPERAADLEALVRRLRMAVSGGSALPVEVHREFERRVGVTVLEGYGLSETSPIASFSRRGEPARPGSIGVPIPGVEMKLVTPQGKEIEGPDEVGEIAIRGHNVMKGYLGRPDATAEVLDADGWFRTGDLARRDADGWYFIVDRAKEMIIRGGFNVYPREVEEALQAHPDVSLCAVIGVAHRTHGQEIKAHVIPVAGATLTAEELIDWARERMAAYKYPRIVELVDSLPMTATGKILKRRLS
ncbi:long-chain-fatty-acid--CoA ligase [Virgisporangium aliadipatigenens]|uniref:Long-chain-fatty-acid--CoA ligase n=1 Tax=Virgisporangium aliadipatigenens TaxID=741659 RepID=A0A8J3YLF6_9ACTN|nr:long-chain fatty acid--CoA ligase [Virgisporangium aliadipatigenens]GIJ46041.1 long-chain-fatty-acid--CoA ligase [Virgisporangium aliadipatigenens]